MSSRSESAILDTVSAVAATATQSEISRLEANPQVAEVVPDRVIPLPATAGTNAAPTDQPGGRAQCTSDPSKPQLEPEALSLTNTENPNPKVPQAHSIATGKGVKVAFMADGIDINNPDYIRPNGTAKQLTTSGSVRGIPGAYWAWNTPGTPPR